MSDIEYQTELEEPLEANRADLEAAVVGHRIVSVDRDASTKRNRWGWDEDVHGTALVLDSGKRVMLVDTDDCCAYTSLRDVIEHLPTMDHVITAVRAEEGHYAWHLVADLGEVLELQVDWSEGNPFYYGYGFDLFVIEAPDAPTS